MHFLLGLIVPLSLAAGPPRIALVDGKAGEPAVVEVSGLPASTVSRLKAAKLTAKQWPEVFHVVVAGGKPEEEQARLPVAGTYILTETGIRFSPLFALLPGREYRAILHPDFDPAQQRSTDPVLLTLSIPKPPPGPRVSIAAVYPSGDRLPENTLRFYIQFSGPVARGEVYRRLKLVRGDGAEVMSPFLELEEELWSADGTRLTVLFHPGRVKRELVPREQEGPILEAGQRYSLSVSEKWEDVEGRPIVSGYRKTFTAGPADEAAVDPAEWSVAAPHAGSRDPLLVRLPKPLDHALLGRMVWVADASGAKVPGAITVGGGERVLTFEPELPWKKGDYHLAIDTRLEDVCGNRVGEPFEVEAAESAPGKIQAERYERGFRVQ